ncbi:MAG: nicotinate-nicotinamide nucleotide adenylyltransferase [Bryobacterales bacterium]|nr:nicotinate-nicotinamide nucleotide adenylyltransferase [Bryobacterales bacterium]
MLASNRQGLGRNSMAHSLGLFPGTFNPPTRAHVELARAALAMVDRVAWILPREFPHKGYEGVDFTGRLRMVQAAIAGEPGFFARSAESGLFIDIARDFRESHGSDTRLVMLCGRDAAERIVNWDYGHSEAFPRMLDEFEMLVASRGGRYEPPAELRHRIHSLDFALDEISATDIRDRIARGESWEFLVAEGVEALVRELYGSGAQRTVPRGT